MDFLNDISELDQGVKSGEIQGFSDFPESGEGFVYAVEAVTKNGKNFIAISIALATNLLTRKTFDLWIAKKGVDKEAACYMSTKRLHDTLWPIAGKNPDADPFSSVWQELGNRLSKASIKVDFTVANESFFNSRTGKDSKTQKLGVLKFRGKGEKIVDAKAAAPYSDADVPF
jgi:hypothetical protein